MDYSGNCALATAIQSLALDSNPPCPVCISSARPRPRSFGPLCRFVSGTSLPRALFYINDRHSGRMFVRMCPYLPFSAGVCLNEHHWLANRMRQEGIDFRQCSNAFLKCSDPYKLQELADSLTAHDLLQCGQKWLTFLSPFFKASERSQAGCQHRLFFAQVEYCDSLIFRRRAALDQLGERLLDANRSIGQPNKITVIFGRKITKGYRGKLQTVI